MFKVIFLLLLICNGTYSIELDGSYIYFSKKEIDNHYKELKKNGEIDYVLPEYNQKLYRKIEQYIEKLYTLFESKLAPYLIQSPKLPRFVITRNNNDDMITSSTVQNKAYTQNFLRIDYDSAISENATAIIAHELAHYFLSHPSHHKPGSVNTIYDYDPGMSLFDTRIWSSVYSNDQIKEFGETIEGIQEIGMFYDVIEFDLPFDFYVESDGFAGVLQNLLDSSSSSNYFCQSAIKLYDAIVDNILYYCSVGLQICKLQRSNIRNIASKIEKFKAPAKKCFREKNTKFQELLFTNILHIDYTPEMISSISKYHQSGDIPQEQKEILDLLFSDQNPVELLDIIVSRQKTEAQKEIQDLSFDFYSVRSINHEDEADILAQLILNNDHEDIMEKFIFKELTDDEISNCYFYINNEKEPPPGFIAVHHRSYCYRYWRFKHMRKELKYDDNNEKKDYVIRSILKLNNILKKS